MPASTRPARGEGRSRDLELERAWLDGEADALDRTHDQYRARLVAVVLKILGDRADAEDVVQKIFVSLQRTRYQGRSSLWTYLYRAAVNGAVNMLRTRRRREAAERNLLEARGLLGDPQGPSAEQTILEGEILASIARALLYVKPQHRRVLVLRIVHGLTNAEIADTEGLPPATVGTWLRRGRAELQRNMKPLLRELRANDPGRLP